MCQVASATVFVSLEVTRTRIQCQQTKIVFRFRLRLGRVVSCVLLMRLYYNLSSFREKQANMEAIHHLVLWILVVCHHTWSQKGKAMAI